MPLRHRFRPSPKAFLLAAAALLSASAAAADEAPWVLPDAHGMSPLFHRYMQMPAFGAVQPPGGGLDFAPGLSLVQGMTNSLTDYGNGATALNRLYDFEAYALDLPIQYGLDDDDALGADLRLYCFAGGFMDRAIATFHKLFGFPNNSRDQVPDNQLLVDLDAGGFRLCLDSPRLALADPVLWYGRRLGGGADWRLSAKALAALPLGLSDGLGGGALPQFGFSLAWEGRPAAGVWLHAASLLNLPLDAWRVPGMAALQYQARSGALLGLGGGWYAGVDLSFRSSPLGNLAVALDYADTFRQPALDLLVSVVWLGGGQGDGGQSGAAWFAVQEDPVSHNSSDVGFFLGGGLRLRP